MRKELAELRRLERIAREAASAARDPELRAVAYEKVLAYLLERRGKKGGGA